MVLPTSERLSLSVHLEPIFSLSVNLWTIPRKKVLTARIWKNEKLSRTLVSSPPVAARKSPWPRHPSTLLTESRQLTQLARLFADTPHRVLITCLPTLAVDPPANAIVRTWWRVRCRALSLPNCLKNRHPTHLPIRAHAPFELVEVPHATTLFTTTLV